MALNDLGFLTFELGCAARNVHSFTADKVQEMADHWEPAPSLYLQLDISTLFRRDDLDAKDITEPLDCGFVKFIPPRSSSSNLVRLKRAKPYGHVSCRQQVSARAEYKRENGGGDFLSGFVLGGVVFGALGYLFAPQISRALWSGDEDGVRKKLPKRMDDDEGLEKTRKTLNEKIAQLNSAIDDVSAQLRAEDGASDATVGASEVESAA